MTRSSNTTAFEHVSIAEDIDILNHIHQTSINLSIFERSVEASKEEINCFIQKNIQLKASGNIEALEASLLAELKRLGLIEGYISKDFSNLLKRFQQLTKATSFRVLFAVVETDMCRRFHTDFNYLRLLCTYAGPATLWLPEAGADRQAHYAGEDNDSIVKDPSLIQQANTDDVLVLKGGMYPNAKAIIHRSPTVQQHSQKRLLLRIDMQK